MTIWHLNICHKSLDCAIPDHCRKDPGSPAAEFIEFGSLAPSASQAGKDADNGLTIAKKTGDF